MNTQIKLTTAIRDPFYWVPDLTPKQREAIKLICHGYSMDRAAVMLGISKASAVSRVYNALKKLGRFYPYETKVSELAPFYFRILEELT